MTFHPGEPGAAAPGGSVKVWSVGLVPLAMISTVAPLVSGLPTTESSLAVSFPSTPTLRLDGSTPGFGSFTRKVFPSTFWSTAAAGDATRADRPATTVSSSATTRAARRKCMATSLRKAARPTGTLGGGRPVLREGFHDSRSGVNEDPLRRSPGKRQRSQEVTPPVRSDRADDGDDDRALVAIVRLHGQARAQHPAVRLPDVLQDDVVLPTGDDCAHARDEIRVARLDAEDLQNLAVGL